jgi:hypothetical protein
MASARLRASVPASVTRPARASVEKDTVPRYAEASEEASRIRSGSPRPRPHVAPSGPPSNSQAPWSQGAASSRTSSTKRSSVAYRRARNPSGTSTIRSQAPSLI